MKIQFIGAAREVTGSKHLITTSEGKKILLDCGMFQGKGMETDAMNRNLMFEPSEINYLILTHAHIDHSGMIPYLVRNGFKGSIICTNATRDLCALMLIDSAHIQEQDMKWFNKKRARNNLPPVDAIYNQHDAEAAMKLFVNVGYDRRLQIETGKINVRFTQTGHMLGSAAVNLEVIEDGKKVNLVYTGDIGRPHNRILPPPEAFHECDYLITESTYGNRLHPEEKESEDDLLKIVVETCVERKGKLIIPSFSIGRTQEIVFVLNNLYNKGLLPRIDVFVDSPLSVNATEVFRTNIECLNEEVRSVMKYDDDPFGFNSLHYIKNVDESKALNAYDKPCIIISSSGMAEAGRIKHHIANNVSDARNTILMVGYCSPTSLGARIQQPGLREISVFGELHEVNARIAKIEAFSGHGDYSEMGAYLKCHDPKRVKKLFLVHGDYEAQQQYAAYLHQEGFEHIEIPEPGEVVEL